VQNSISSGTLLFQQSNLDLWWDEVNQWLYADWKGSQAVEEVKFGCEQMLRMLKLKNADSVLNDNTNVEGTWGGAAEWLATDWFPRMRAAGLRHFAWVSSSCRFSQVSTDATLARAGAGTAEVFPAKTDAAEWLKGQRLRNSRPRPGMP
jgi:hypothetical protein